MTLGNAAAAKVRLIVWCKECQHQVEPDPAEMAVRCSADTPVVRLARVPRLFPLQQPPDRHGGYRHRAGVAPPLARAHRRQNQSRNARRSLRLRRAITRYRASNAASEQHHPGPGDHY
jgi:hypothetical protein